MIGQPKCAIMVWMINSVVARHLDESQFVHPSYFAIEVRYVAHREKKRF